MIYFFEDDAANEIKIGSSETVEFRVRTLAVKRRCRPKLLATLPGNHLHERHIHLAFEHAALGHEWFRPSRGLRAFVRAVASRASDKPMGLREIISLLSRPSRSIQPDLDATSARLLDAWEKTAIPLMFRDLAAATYLTQPLLARYTYATGHIMRPNDARVLGDALGVRPDWLRFGTGARASERPAQSILPPLPVRSVRRADELGCVVVEFGRTDTTFCRRYYHSIDEFTALVTA